MNQDSLIIIEHQAVRKTFLPSWTTHSIYRGKAGGIEKRLEQLRRCNLNFNFRAARYARIELVKGCEG